MNTQTPPLPAAPASPEERTRCEVWTRVMGYHRPVASFNIGKKSEHRERRFFDEKKIKNTETAKSGLQGF